MPSIWILYLLAYMDRSNIGNAKIAGMDEALDLSDTDYSLAINLFQVSYIVFSVPSNMILARMRPSIYIPTIMFLWGIVVAAKAAMQTPAHLWGLRFALGALEAGFSPAVFHIFSMWYRKSEQTKRFLVFWLAGILGSAFGGILAGAIANGLDGAHGIPGWRWLFLIEGVITCGVALLAPLVLLDYPATCSKFSPEERALAVSRQELDGQNINVDKERRMNISKALWYAITTPAHWIIFIAFMTVDGSFSIAYFYPTLVEGLGYNSTTAQFMTAPLYVCAVPAAIALSIFGDKKPSRRGYYLSLAMFLGAVFSAITAAVTNFTARYVLLCFLNMGLYCTIPLSLAFSTTAMAAVEPEIRSIALAWMSALGNLAQVYNSYIWPDRDAPRYLTGFCTYAALLMVGAGFYRGGSLYFGKRPLKARIGSSEQMTGIE
ncbi:major facilitator superfamily domain-containing protein [Paraphoma chrysanthemicola]|uniref:Major facilitator superfamily domain-containing protein n=1 Tax=Paraphoma chrysanthemicola TaxID=798071 RepID=A0A8K0R5S8_9PLEO|nr:major facilitator superfamily domain-containing protein [Paraphoma chrysanthemicola]